MADLDLLTSPTPVSGRTRSRDEEARVLPASCRECYFHANMGSLCQRHAPGVGTEAFEIARWPLVRPTNRCGDGAELGDGTGPGVVRCGWCIHWLQPEGAGVRPDYKQGMGAAWWELSGFCTRYAPAPSAEEDRRAEWRVTHVHVHVHSGCGEGEQIPADGLGGV